MRELFDYLGIVSVQYIFIVADDLRDIFEWDRRELR